MRKTFRQRNKRNRKTKRRTFRKKGGGWPFSTGLQSDGFKPLLIKKIAQYLSENDISKYGEKFKDKYTPEYYKGIIRVLLDNYMKIYSGVYPKENNRDKILEELFTYFKINNISTQTTDTSDMTNEDKENIKKMRNQIDYAITDNARIKVFIEYLLKSEVQP